MKVIIRVLWILSFSLCIFIFPSSCVNTKKATYFNDLSNSDFPDKDTEPQIQKNDLLSIYVTSPNPEASALFNMAGQTIIQTPTQNSTTSQSTGYLVDADGNIVFPLLGTIGAAGLTQKQLSDKIVNTLVEKKMLVNPIVSIRLLNFRVTVLGEVARPTVALVPTGKISLLEALGMAGDLTIYARRDNLLLIRVEDGKKMTRRINLNDSTEIFTSPFYYLRSNDVIYAEPNKTKIASASNTRQLLPIILSGLTFITIVIDRLTR